MTRRVNKPSTKERKAQVIQALHECLGIVTYACKKVHLDTKTFYRWCKEDAEFLKASLATENTVHDFVEGKLLENIKDRKEASVIFYAKTKMKNRGYVERTEHTGKDGGPMQLQAVPLSDVERTLLGEMNPMIDVTVIEEKKS